MIGASQSEAAADLLRCASNVLSIEFYATKSDNRAAELNCRIFGLSPLTESQVKAFAAELNFAIIPVINAQANHLQRQAQEIIKPER